MKNLLNVILKITAVVFILFLTACQSDVYHGGDDPNPEESLSGIPDDFKYLTVDSKKLTVKVMDVYEGKKYYTVEVFDANPFNDPSAILLAGGKANVNTPFEVNLVLPKTLKAIYLRQTDPKGYQSVTGMEVKDGDLYFDYNDVLSGKTTLKSVSNGAELRADDEITGEPGDYDELFTSGLSQAKEINGSEKLEVNGVYKLTNDFKGALQLPTGNITLYIGAKLSLTENIQLRGDAEIYVLREGTFAGEQIKLDMNGGKLYNAGTLALNDLQLTEVKLYNHSNSKIYAKNLTLNGVFVENNCLLKIDNTLNLTGKGSQIICNQVSSIVSSKYYIGNTDSYIIMYPKSLFETDQITGNGNQLHTNITGEAYVDFQDMPLFKVNGSLKLHSGSGGDYTVGDSYITFTGNVCYAAKEVISASLEPSMFQLDYNSLPTNAQGDCYGVEYKPSDATTPDADNPEYNEQSSETPTYTYLFEDNWPSFGDYDMNDLVLDVNIANVGVVNNNATSVVLTTTVRAVGASKPLYAFAQIEAPGAGETIVPLFDGEAHEFLGKTVGDKINTYNYTCDSRTTVQTVGLNGIKGLVNALNLNVFVVWGDVNSGKWNEIHLPNFKATQNAVSSATTNQDYKYNGKAEGAKPEYDNMMWALMIPTRSFTSYPKEGVSIMDAYDGFITWARSNGAAVGDWYFHPTSSDKIYEGK
ncbi:LruC domain-containing protein [Parabacteroides bouchesdurhonensis]|uniref:LruC domain-containing protein n=1 Tax=Parabacteroides bouchesdurhonensis TaxID=1936995 RepID=UPI00131BA643|nr:LruC domain-containing protein [Parabacteroides bouchesdurhonensis]